MSVPSLVKPAATVPTLDPRVVQEVLLGGDLAKLSTDQRIAYYKNVCESLGLNPLTKPFAYLKLSGKEVLYATKDCTEQLRYIHGISIDPASFVREVIDGIYVVTAAATVPNGRTDVSTGAVTIDGLKGESRANAMMKAETKAKRRVTLSICGLGMLDETEIDSIPGAVPVLEVTPAPPPPEGFDAFWKDAVFTADNDGIGPLTALWKGTTTEVRAHVNAHKRADWEQVKQTAEATSAKVKSRERPAKSPENYSA